MKHSCQNCRTACLVAAPSAKLMVIGEHMPARLLVTANVKNNELMRLAVSFSEVRRRLYRDIASANLVLLIE